MDSKVPTNTLSPANNAFPSILSASAADMASGVGSAFAAPSPSTDRALASSLFSETLLSSAGMAVYPVVLAGLGVHRGCPFSEVGRSEG